MLAKLGSVMGDPSALAGAPAAAQPQAAAAAEEEVEDEVEGEEPTVHNTASEGVCT